MAGLRKTNCGFSLTEVLMAVGILSVGLTFIAGVFPVAIHLTTIATERTIAAAVADEAFTKIEFCGVDPAGINLAALLPNNLTNFIDIFPPPASPYDIDPNEYKYPSAAGPKQKQYFWSALCRLTEAYHPVNNPNPPVQVTVFVSRKISPNLAYPDPNGSGTVNRPMPIKINVSGTAGDNELKIINAGDEQYINNGYMIVDDQTGRIYRVLEHYRDATDTILLDRNWQVSNPTAVWVVPPPVVGTPPVASGRHPCIAVYQKTIRF